MATLILPDDTFATYAARRATEARARAEAARRARISGASTNLDYLMAAGVVISEDAAFDNAMRAQGLAEEVKRTGKPAATIEAERQVERDRDDARNELRHIQQMGETMAEWSARVRAAQDAAVGTKDNGRACSHVRTKKNLGWVNRIGFFTMLACDGDGYPFKCCRCGAEVTVPKPAQPTEQAKLAAKLLADLAEVSR